mmetsp:Transcript_41833/g.99220  ORF Transcript_41833/g.99220 Transcript_41833/m.99220 type:complete len:226 (+) Transcript_41833:1082-1759(+)
MLWESPVDVPGDHLVNILLADADLQERRVSAVRGHGGGDRPLHFPDGSQEPAKLLPRFRALQLFGRAATAEARPALEPRQDRVDAVVLRRLHHLRIGVCPSLHHLPVAHEGVRVVAQPRGPWAATLFRKQPRRRAGRAAGLRLAAALLLQNGIRLKALLLHLLPCHHADLMVQVGGFVVLGLCPLRPAGARLAHLQDRSDIVAHVHEELNSHPGPLCLRLMSCSL